MTQQMHWRVLGALADGKERHIIAVRLFSESSAEEMQDMAERGLVRFPDVLGGGKRICITPKGLEVLARHKKLASLAAP